MCIKEACTNQKILTGWNVGVSAMWKRSKVESKSMIYKKFDIQNKTNFN